MTDMRSCDVVVVGAGFAGVTAARDLSARGLEVALLEAQDRIGGRTWSRTMAGVDGEIVEYGGMYVAPRRQPNIRRELERYGIPLTAVERASTLVHVHNGERGAGWPIPAAELVDLERACLRVAEAARRISPSSPLHAQPLADLDISFTALLDALEMPPRTRSVLDSYAARLAGADPDQVSVLPILARTAAYDASPSKQFLETGALRFTHGTQQLLQAMLDSSTVDVQLSTPVVSITHDGHRVAVTTANGDEFSGAACVIAVPSNALRRIEFTPLLHDAKRRVTHEHRGRAYKINVIADGLPPGGVAGIALGRSAVPGLYTVKELAPGTALLCAIGNEAFHPLDPTSLDDAQRVVETFFPGARVLVNDSYDWNTDPYFNGTWRADAPGRAREFVRVMNQPEGRVVFAGADQAESLWQNYMEGAIVSAQKAVAEVIGLVRAGRTAPLS
jgi:monoamine oxidase